MLFKDYFLQLIESKKLLLSAADMLVLLPEANNTLISYHYNNLFKYHELGKSTLSLETFNSVVSKIKHVFEKRICNKNVFKIKTESESKQIEGYFDLDDDGVEHPKDITINKYSIETFSVSMDDFKIEYVPRKSYNEFGISFNFMIHFNYLKGGRGLCLKIEDLEYIDDSIEFFVNQLLNKKIFNFNEINEHLNELNNDRLDDLSNEMNALKKEIFKKQAILSEMSSFYHSKKSMNLI